MDKQPIIVPVGWPRPRSNHRRIIEVRGYAKGAGAPDLSTVTTEAIAATAISPLTVAASAAFCKEIAPKVYRSDKMVKNYLSSILSKLNLRRRCEAAASSPAAAEGFPTSD